MNKTKSLSNHIMFLNMYKSSKKFKSNYVYVINKKNK